MTDGLPDTGLLVVADLDTPGARGAGLITAQRRHGRPFTGWSDTPEELTSVTAAAAVVVEHTGSSGH